MKKNLHVDAITRIRVAAYLCWRLNDAFPQSTVQGGAPNEFSGVGELRV
jgi:hypothetical protein